MPTGYISKSSYMAGLQCQKLLWHRINKPDLFYNNDDDPNRTMEQGKQVGLIAQSLFPDGVSIPFDVTVSERLRLTSEAIEKSVPVYEAALSAEGLFVQVDILTPAPDGKWDINEVKSSTNVKDEHLPDIAFQKYVCEKAGLNIKECRLVHIDNTYIRSGDIDVEALFKSEDITGQLEPYIQNIADKVKGMREKIGLPASPAVEIGPHCTSPYDCPLIESCWGHLPEHSLFDLYRLGARKWPLYEDGAREITDMPADFQPNQKHTIQIESARNGQPHIDKGAIKTFLSSLSYPLYFLDFETMNPAVPLFDGTWPYQQVPFQFSLHVIDKPGAEPKHVSWLAEGTDDPRAGFLTALQDAIGPDGDIVAFNMSFEITRLKELATAFPEYKSWINELNDRFVDLLVPFRQFAYYHADQHGSCSLKDVLPAVAGKSYEGMEIADGETASTEFMRVTYGEVADEERNNIRQNLEKYCELDTLGMVWILDALADLVS